MIYAKYYSVSALLEALKFGPFRSLRAAAVYYHAPQLFDAANELENE